MEETATYRGILSAGSTAGCLPGDDEKMALLALETITMAVEKEVVKKATQEELRRKKLGGKVLGGSRIWTPLLDERLRAVREKYATLEGTLVELTPGALDNMALYASRADKRHKSYPGLYGRPAPLVEVEDAVVESYRNYCGIEHTLKARTAGDPERRELLLGLLYERGAMSDNPIVLREAALHEHVPLDQLKSECSI